MALDSSSASAAVAARIKQVRNEIGINQTEFARALGVSRSTVSDVEQASVKIPVDILFSIADRFGQQTKKASVTWLITGDDRPMRWGENPYESPLNNLLALDSRALMCAIRSLRENADALPTVEIATKFFQLVMSNYLSRMEELKRSGIDVEDARAQAERECARISLGGVDTDVNATPRSSSRRRVSEEGKASG